MLFTEIIIFYLLHKLNAPIYFYIINGFAVFLTIVRYGSMIGQFMDIPNTYPEHKEQYLEKDEDKKEEGKSEEKQ